MTQLSVKIMALELGATKTIQIQGNDSIHEVCREVREKFGDRAGGNDHGLYYPLFGKWLIPNKLVEFYDLKSGDVLEFKKKHRPIKVKMLDSALKTVIIDESLSVYMVVQTICDKIGISNADEYSLLPDNPIIEKKDKKEKKERNITEETKWLNPDKTLAEQFVLDTDIVILKKKFFFTDQNIDKNDPVQLNLLYNQARDSILTGTHPCSYEESIQFAAVMCQIHFGNFDSAKHKHKSIDIREYLPKDYLKKKDAEKKIFADYNKLIGLNPINAKNRYVQLSRSLKTYGYTFFSVKEKNKANNKQIGFLLGVTKQTIVRVDLETKEIIQQWQLTQLRRWAASPNSFTLDFGDYADAYHCVQTKEGDQISLLIAGYIDIILKKRKEAEKPTPDDKEGLATIEEYAKPGKATNISIITSGQKTATESRQISPQNQSTRSIPMSFQSFGLQSLDQSSPTQQSASMAIRNAFAMIHHSITDLGTVLTIPPFGIDAASLAWRQQTIDVNANNIASVVSMQLATIGSLVLQVSGIPNKMDYELITSSITQLPGLFAQLNQNLKVLRSVLDDENLKEHLLAVALDLANSLAHVIDSSQPLCMGDINALSNFHDAARIFSVNSSDLLTCLELLEVSETSEQELLECCNFLSKAVTDLITKSKNTSKSLGNEVVEDVSSKIMDTFASTNRLIISTMVLHPALNSQICQDQVNEGASIVRENINILCNVFDELIGQNDINLLADASRRIEESLTKLLYCASHVGQKEIEYNALDQQFLSIMEAIDNLNESFDDSQNMLSCARDLTLGTTQFIALLKQHGESYDNNDDLLSAAKALAEATSRMVSAAKSFSKDSDNSEKEDRLKEAIADVMKLTCKASTPEIRENSMKRLAKCAKEVISTSNQVSNASKNASACNRNQASQMKLTQVLKKLQYVQPDVITSIKNFSRSPCDIVTQNKLLQSSTSIIAPSEVVIDSCHAAQNTVSDVHAQTQLASTCTEFEFNVNDLKKLVIVVEELLSYVSAKEAIAAIKLLQDSFLMTEESIVVNNTTSARKGITIHDNGARDLQVSLKSNLDQSNDLLMAISDLSSTIGRFTVDCTEEEGQSFTSNALMLLSVMANATQEYSAVEKDIDFKSDMLQSAFKLSEVISLIIVQANASSDQKETSEIKRLQGDAVLLLDHMSVSVASKVSVDSATTQSSTITDYGSEMFIYETGFEDEWASSVQNSVLAVQGAISDLTKSAKGTPDEIETSITGFKKAIKKLNRMSTMYTSEDTSSTQISDALQSLNAFSHNFIGDVKVSYLSQEDTGMTFELFAASKMISDSVNGLLGMCLNSTETNPGDNHDEQEYKEEYVNQDNNRATSKAQPRQKAERKKMNRRSFRNPLEIPLEEEEEEEEEEGGGKGEEGEQRKRRERHAYASDAEFSHDEKKHEFSAKSKILEMDAQVNILEIEKALERARIKLAAIRKAKYISKTDGVDGSISINKLLSKSTLDRSQCHFSQRQCRS